MENALCNYKTTSKKLCPLIHRISFFCCPVYFYTGLYILYIKPENSLPIIIATTQYCNRKSFACFCK